MTTPDATHTNMMNQHHFHQWRGTAYEIGVRHGSTLRNEIATECEPALQAETSKTNQTRPDFLQTYLAEYRPWFEKYAPRALEEIQGIADGSKLGFAYSFFAATRDGAKLASSQQDACTAFYCAGRTTSDGHIYLGQLKDTDAPLSRYHILRKCYDDGLIVVTLNYPGWIANVGMNSHGVSCTGNSLYAQPAPGNTVPFTLLRYLIAEAQSVRQVERLAKELPLENCCMMVADAYNNAICIENVAGNCDIRNISGQAFGHANSVLCERLKHYQNAVLKSPSSPCRQRNIQARLDSMRGQLSVDTLKVIMADHQDYPHSICRHPADDDPIVTTAAFIADCTAREMHIAIGNPCNAMFDTYQAI